MEKRIKTRILNGKKLTKRQVEWTQEKIGKYEADCDMCFFNLCLYLGIDPWQFA